MQSTTLIPRSIPAAPAAAALAAADEELSSVRRVRNRLATSPDAAVPRILSILLPRLLRKMDGNWEEVARLSSQGRGGVGAGEWPELQERNAGEETLADAKEPLRVRRLIHEEYRVVIDHAVDRADGNPDLDPAPFVETVADFVASSCTASYERDDRIQTTEDDGEAKHWPYRKKDRPRCRGVGADRLRLSERPGFRSALGVLRAGVAQTNSARGGGTAPRDALTSAWRASVMAVEDLHRERADRDGFENYGGVVDGGIDDGANAGDEAEHIPNDEGVVRGGSDPWIDAGWLALDLMALLTGIRPVGLGGGSASHVNVASPGNKQEEPQSPSPQSLVSSIAPLAGDGMYDLFSDLVLYRPGSACCGLSCLGVARMQSPALDLDTPPPYSDWVEMKLAALRIGAGSRRGEGIFGRKGMAVSDKEDVPTASNDSDYGKSASRALVLLILSSPGRGSPFGDAIARKLERTAGSFLRSHLDLGKVRSSPSRSLVGGVGSKKKKVRVGGDGIESLGSAHGTAPVVVDAMTSLLGLVLGDAEAGSVRQRHVEEWGGTDSGDGRESAGPSRAAPETAAPAGAAADTVRSPLSPRRATVILDFVENRFQIKDAGGDALVLPSDLTKAGVWEKVALLVNFSLAAAQLVLQLYEPNEALRRAVLAQIGWGDGDRGPPASAARLLRALAAWLGEAQRRAARGSISGGYRKPYERWLDGICVRTFDAAAKFLRSDVLAALVEGAAPARRDSGGGIEQNAENDDAALPLARGGEVPHRVRGRMAAHRRVQRMRQTRLVPPVEIRRCCVEVVQDMAKYAVLQRANDPPGDNACPTRRTPSFDVPTLLLNCVVLDEALSPHISLALERVLETYECVVRTYTRSMSDDQSLHSADFLTQSAAPFLPALLTASTSESHVARAFAARWANGIVRYLDPDAAGVLCTYLVADPDSATSKAARECIDSMNLEEGAKNKKGGVGADIAVPDGAVLFLDSAAGIDKELLQTRLDREIHNLAQELSITKDAAAILLQHHRFSCDRAAEDIRLCKDLEQTLDRCGVRWRCSLILCEDGSDCCADAKSPKAREQPCGICYDDELSREEMYALPCGHMFCRACFRSFLQVKFEDPMSLLGSSCPEHGCNERIAGVDVKELLGSEKVDKWRKYLFESFVAACNEYRWCPGAGCSMVAVSEMGRGSATCTGCETRFCFECGAEPHSPANCTDVGDFMQLFHSSEYWIKKHAKRCPNSGCNVPIEKNTGCNHMTCTSCRTHFCWLCASVIGEDGNLDRHVCNRYDPRAEWSEKRRNEFYLSRFEACMEGEKFARKGLDALTEKKSELLADDPPCVDSEEFGVLIKARKTLLEILDFLKWTYVIAWAWQPANAVDAAVPTHEGDAFSREASVAKDLFESHQATLDVFAEKLGSLTEVNLEELHMMGGEWRFKMHFRALEFHACALDKYRERMVEFLHRSPVKHKKCFVH